MRGHYSNKGPHMSTQQLRARAASLRMAWHSSVGRRSLLAPQPLALQRRSMPRSCHAHSADLAAALKPAGQRWWAAGHQAGTPAASSRLG